MMTTKKKKKDEAIQLVPEEETEDVVNHVTLVTDENKPDDSSATFGNPAEVDGVEGYIVTASDYDDKTGFPTEVIFRPRDNGNTLMTVAYSDVKALVNGYR